MPNKSRIDSKLLALAADKLDHVGKHHDWWKTKHDSWRDLDEISKEEFLDIVWSIIKIDSESDTFSDQANVRRIYDYQVQIKENSILIGIATENAVLDIKSTMTQIKACLDLLQQNKLEFSDESLGTFGEFKVKLNCCRNGDTSLFIDGPIFDEARTQSAAIWINKQALQELLECIYAKNIFGQSAG